MIVSLNCCDLLFRHVMVQFVTHHAISFLRLELLTTINYTYRGHLSRDRQATFLHLPTTINQISEVMSSGSRGIGSTLTGGIQDIPRILPLLGTEQCSIHVSSALTRGYLYAASAPMSLFGSLGVVSAGFKTLLACFSFGNIEGNQN